MTDAPERIWMFAKDPPRNLITCGDTEYVRADLPPKVKPLEWVKEQTGNSLILDALGFNSEYRIVVFSHGVTLWRDGWTGEWQEAESVEAAKSAAQADYETRILSALVQP